MVFLVDMAFAIELIALVLGGVLLYFLKAHKIRHSFAKFIAFFVIIVAFLSMACTMYYGTKYWLQGAYEKPYHKKHAMFDMYKKHMKEKKAQESEEY